MIVCKKCGNQNPDGETFCTSCRAFLEWSGEKVVEAPPPAPPPPPVSAPQPDFVDRMKQAVGLDRPPAPPPVPTDIAAPPPASAMGGISAPIAGAGAPAMASPSSIPAPAPPDAMPVAVVPRPSEIPAAVLPQAVAPAPERPRQPPKTDTATGQRYKPGDLICGNCGAGNNPERHFCQRCGANLSAAAIVKTPWYRKLLPARRPVAAGTRPSSAPVERAWGSALFRIIAAGVIVALVLAYLVVPPLRSRVNGSVASLYATAHRHFQPVTSPVRPSDATASSQVGTHPARLTIDLIKESYWAANTATDKQPWLRLIFATPVDLDTVLITSGAGNDFATLARPKDVHIVFSDKSSVNLTLKDDPKPQPYDLSARQVTYAEIHIVSVYVSAQSTDVAINEVEFFKIT